MPTESSSWYYAKNQEQFGPVPIEDLRKLARAHELQPDDLVWCEGMPDWVPAGQIPELTPSTAGAAAVPPPLSAAVGHFPQSQAYARAYSARGAATARPSAAPFSPRERGQRVLLIVASAIAVISLFLPLFVIHYDINTATTALPQAFQQLLQGYTSAFVSATPHVVWGYDTWWSVLVFLLGIIGLAAGIVDLAMQTQPVTRSITRWVHWPVYAAILLFILIGLIYSYESGQGFSSNIWLWIPISPLLVLGLSIAALAISIRICADQRATRSW